MFDLAFKAFESGRSLQETHARTHIRSACFLGVAAHVRQEVVVAEPVADRLGNLRRVFAERSVPSLDDIGHVTLLQTRYTRQGKYATDCQS